MTRLQTRGYTSAWVSASVHNMLSIVMLGVVQESLNSGLNERPGTSVKRLLLTPNNGLGVGVFVKILLQQLPWEWIELFNTGDGGVLDVVIGAVFLEGSVDLTGTENNTVNCIVVVDSSAVLWILNNPSELRITSKLLDRRACNRMTEKRFREENDKSWSKLVKIAG